MNALNESSAFKEEKPPQTTSSRLMEASLLSRLVRTKYVQRILPGSLRARDRAAAISPVMDPGVGDRSSGDERSEEPTRPVRSAELWRTELQQRV